MSTDAALHSPEARRAGAVLTIDLDAIAANWRVYADLARGSGSEAGAVVKAAAYGLDAAHAAPALHIAGCETFFVAAISEGIELRETLGAITDANPAIHVFNGLMDGAERDFVEHGLTPVLNTLGEVDAWRAFCTGYGQALACDLHVDTGMARLGLDAFELAKIVADPARLSDLNLDVAFSHLTCAEDPDDPQNALQLAKFQQALAPLNPGRASLANSSGAFLGADYHFDLIRPGAALYGVNPTPYAPQNPMAQVVRLQGKILQVRTIDTPQGVGYGSTHRAASGARIATISVGYADGYPRSLSNAGDVYFGEHRASIVGRVSMDLITVDISDVPDDLTRPGMLADLIGPLNPIDDVATKAGTIGYEILTQLGRRYHRIYTGGGYSA